MPTPSRVVLKGKWRMRIAESREVSERIRKILTLLAGPGGDSSEEVQALLRDVSELHREVHGSGMEEMPDLPPSVEAVDYAEVPGLSLFDQQRLLEQVQDVKLRMLAVAAAIPQGRGCLLEEWAREAGPGSAVQVFPSGVRTSVLFGVQVVLLPEVSSKRHCWEVLDSLNELSLSPDEPCDWVVDCSSLRHPEPLVISSLIGYQKSLRSVGRTARLIWLPMLAIPEGLLERVRSIFDLELLGNHLFSR